MEAIAVRHGSVKDLEVFAESGSESLGLADMVFRPSYSIFDLKRMPDLIPGRESQAVMTAFNFERLENSRVPTQYLGVVNRDGNVVSLDQMQEPPTRMRVKLAAIREPEVRIADGTLTFSYEFFEQSRGMLNNIGTPIEWIYRNGLPQGSSVLRNLERAMEKGDVEYVERMLRRLGLEEYLSPLRVPPPNIMLPRPYGNFTTKYEPLGDRGLGDDYDVSEAIKSGDYSKSEAVRISGLTLEQFDEMVKVRDRVAQVIKKRGEEVGITDWDGKLEFAWAYGPMVIDAVGTPDENRLFHNDKQVSKEVARQLYDVVQPELRKDIERAQKQAAEDAVRTGRLRNWREYLTVDVAPLDAISPYLKPLVGEMHMALANQWTGIPFYNVRPLGVVMQELNGAVADVTARYRR